MSTGWGLAVLVLLSVAGVWIGWQMAKRRHG